MKKTRIFILLLAATGTSSFAQHWEVGGTAGGSFLPGVSVTSPLGAATTGFAPGVAFGAYIGQNLYPRVSGEIHYGFVQSNLRIKSGSTTATFSGLAHMVHYDILLHTNRKGSRTQLFAAFGGGMKIFQGTGKEQAYQPLSQFAYFTRTRVIKGMGTFGGGVKCALSERVTMRVEVRDYLTMFPKDLIAPAPGAKFGGLLHDIVPTVGISYVY